MGRVITKKGKITAKDGVIRMGFVFSPEDKELLYQLHGYIETETKVKYLPLSEVLRMAIREAVAKRVKKYGEG